jgi:hypothetical protein
LLGGLLPPLEGQEETRQPLDAIHTLPHSCRSGHAGMGTTHWERQPGAA